MEYLQHLEQPAAPLPPYTGTRGTCTKCRTAPGDVDVTYRATPRGLAASGHRHLCGDEPSPPAGASEWMLRTCRTCGFQWCEALPEGPAQ